MLASKRVADDLTRVIDTANAPIFGIDTSGKINVWNVKAASTLGFSRDETMGHDFVEDFITEEFKQPVNQVLSLALEGHYTANFEVPALILIPPLFAPWGVWRCLKIAQFSVCRGMAGTGEAIAPKVALFTKAGERREVLLNATTRRGPGGEVTQPEKEPAS